MEPVRVRPITLLCILGFENNLAHMTSRQDNVSRTRTMSLGQRSMSQSALNFCAYTSVEPVRVRPITWASVLGFINNVAQMIIIMIRECVANKNNVASSKVKVIDHT